MINLLMSGCNGGMGKTITAMVNETENMKIIAGFDSAASETGAYPVYNNFEKFQGKADVIIDFSHFSAFDKVVDYAVSSKTPLVMATTGLTPENEARLEKISSEIPVFRTANMSIGVNVLLGLVATAAKQLENFDIEIIEKHHNKKVDSPSGTALMLANAINDAMGNKFQYTYGREGKSTKRFPDELGIHAVRGGTIAGEHTVIYAGEDEIIEIQHTAASKKVFAKGAIAAAGFLADKKEGLYDMKKMLGL
ncbi:MAG: 4-hydroxy-tetrahydrodipicolinate reductase [Eubacteriaceae bacterium]|nr:4-hydroxy-tetrahydrodipicolinate reductase [Eubacteriaceae bacterium]